MPTNPPTILIAGVGNELRQDDAFGVLLAQQLQDEGALPASVLFGVLWDRFGAGAAFVTGAGLALAATLLLLLVSPLAQQQRAPGLV